MYFVVRGLEESNKGSYIPVLIEAKDMKELEEITKKLWNTKKGLVVAVFHLIM